MVRGYHSRKPRPAGGFCCPGRDRLREPLQRACPQKADGEIVPDLSESWTISSDGKTYTFQIKDGLTYKAVKGASTDHTITAEDFVFAFRRIFQPQTNSPYAVEFAALENSAAVLAGTADASTLGVSAAGPLTLVFRLSEKDDNFLAKLTLPGAMPCDEAFLRAPAAPTA